MSEVHYFPRYTQKENFATNNTLLLLLRLHEYSHLKFEKFLGALCDEQDIDLPIQWLQFQQQKGTGKSVVDGFIAQGSFRIAVETKLSEFFDGGQLQRHLAVFGGAQHKLLILLSPTEISERQIETVRRQSAERTIQILLTTFERIASAVRECLSPFDEAMITLVNDYEAFCSGEGLLPEDQYLLFVPPCNRSFNTNRRFQLYYCPANWTRRKAKFIGLYLDKSVKAIGRISKVVACDANIKKRAVTVVPGETAELTKEEEGRILGAVMETSARCAPGNRTQILFV